MTLVQLKHFIALAQTASFGKAATAVHLTQAALSRSIRALEDELGQPLFDRVGRVSELTPYGREALARARELVLASEDLRDHARRSSTGKAGALRIGLGSGPGALLMTPLLLEMAHQRPGVHVSITRANTELLLQALRDRALDAVVVDARSVPSAPDLSMDTVHAMPGAWMVRPGHPLAKQRSAVRFEQVLGYPIAATPLSEEVARALVSQYGARAHPEQCVTLRCDEIPSLVDVVRQCDAVLLGVRAAAPDLVALKLTSPMTASARFGLVTLNRRTAPPGLDVVRVLMAQRMAEHKKATPAKRARPPQLG
jgi:DNA-binding transcriptional LysR family regulator